MFDLIDDWGPEKIVVVADEKTQMKGVLVIDNTARGMGKGGTRMQPTVSVEEIARLARVMTWKWAAVDLFYGGAKAGIQADPNSPYKEEILRSFVRKLSNEVPEEYVFGLDMGLTENDAAIIIDELGRGTAVGTPASLGGVPYDALGVTGFGVAEVTDEIAKSKGLAGARVAIQGFGAVGRATARRMHELGYTVCAISTAKGALADSQGLDIPTLDNLYASHGDAVVEEFPSQRIELGQELFTDAEILIPAALQDVIGVEDVSNLKSRLIVEGANLPTSPEAQAELHARGVTVVPDFIANAGGVVSAAFAMEARQSAFRVEPDNIFATISSKLRGNAASIIGVADDTNRLPHVVARDIAQQRVRDAMDLRGRRLPR
ncbi:Glu/Leu/Phe/Val family dehydrogenase [Corynebacterium aquilae]|uniref:Glutamate dehydrogenase n=1 Tax=Corynebacterium aquilae DSM 44791 TaxID=1431546 RepID=A0A1L7CFE9_9CORY|nr:Glu/Leu/Phe/Val dehydrogenase dimerization domain-containing protein [Corynebacterium aquilae]APT84600.1 glutamate dehydrogenase [Corynebacterium aquilae DSM 44791]